MARGKRGALKSKCTKVCHRVGCANTSCTFAHKPTDMNVRAFKKIECTNETKCKGDNCIYYHTAEEKDFAEKLRSDPNGDQMIMFFMFYGALEAMGQVRLPKEQTFRFHMLHARTNGTLQVSHVARTNGTLLTPQDISLLQTIPDVICWADDWPDAQRIMLQTPQPNGTTLSEEELVEKVQRLSADPIPISAGSWQGPDTVDTAWDGNLKDAQPYEYHKDY
eukprot:Hpha_TRINITY_DN15533_c2_g5::TRINITY_DN15533_c2_g5_i1::g.105216::m.105216